MQTATYHTAFTFDCGSVINVYLNSPSTLIANFGGSTCFGGVILMLASSLPLRFFKEIQAILVKNASTTRGFGRIMQYDLAEGARGH